MPWPSVSRLVQGLVDIRWHRADHSSFRCPSHQPYPQFLLRSPKTSSVQLQYAHNYNMFCVCSRKKSSDILNLFRGTATCLQQLPNFSMLFFKHRVPDSWLVSTVWPHFKSKAKWWMNRQSRKPGVSESKFSRWYMKEEQTWCWWSDN